MSEPRIFVVGSDGLVGRAVAEAAKDAGVFVGAVGRDVDVRDTARVAAYVKGASHVVVCAARAYVEGCEVDAAGTAAVNVDAVTGLAAAVKGVVVAFSSEYVFDDAKAAARVEGDVRAPLNEYGRQKLRLEDGLAAFPSLVVRTSAVYGPEPRRKNFVLSLWDRARKQPGPIDVPDDQVVTPTWAPALARLVTAACRRGSTGVLHLAGPEIVRRDELARRVLQVRGIDPARVRSVPTSSLGLKAARPKTAALDTGAARALFGDRNFVGIDDGLARLLALEGG